MPLTQDKFDERIARLIDSIDELVIAGTRDVADLHQRVMIPVIALSRSLGNAAVRLLTVGLGRPPDAGSVLGFLRYAPWEETAEKSVRRPDGN